MLYAKAAISSSDELRTAASKALAERLGFEQAGQLREKASCSVAKPPIQLPAFPLPYGSDSELAQQATAPASFAIDRERVAAEARRRLAAELRQALDVQVSTRSDVVAAEAAAEMAGARSELAGIRSQLVSEAQSSSEARAGAREALVATTRQNAHAEREARERAQRDGELCAAAGDGVAGARPCVAMLRAPSNSYRYCCKALTGIPPHSHSVSSDCFSSLVFCPAAVEIDAVDRARAAAAREAEDDARHAASDARRQGMTHYRSTLAGQVAEAQASAAGTTAAARAEEARAAAEERAVAAAQQAVWDAASAARAALTTRVAAEQRSQMAAGALAARAQREEQLAEVPGWPWRDIAAPSPSQLARAQVAARDDISAQLAQRAADKARAARVSVCWPPPGKTERKLRSTTAILLITTFSTSVQVDRPHSCRLRYSSRRPPRRTRTTPPPWATPPWAPSCKTSWPAQGACWQSWDRGAPCGPRGWRQPWLEVGSSKASRRAARAAAASETGTSAAASRSGEPGAVKPTSRAYKHRVARKPAVFWLAPDGHGRLRVHRGVNRLYMCTCTIDRLFGTGRCRSCSGQWPAPAGMQQLRMRSGHGHRYHTRGRAQR